MTSEPGQGTTVEIRLPLTLAIMAALLVRAGGESFAVPIDRIDRTVRLDDRTVHSVSGQRVIVVDGEVIPIVDAGEVLAGRPTGADASAADRAVLLRGQTGRAVALLVSALVGQRELVARPMPGSLATGTPVSGAAVLSDGEIALIVDCDALITDQDRADAPAPSRA
jgi:two-component system chemotaxis sensor kinase CheA